MAAKKSKENANLLDVASDLSSGKKVDLGAVVDLAAQAISESSEKKSKTSSKKKKEDDNLISQLFQEVVNYPQFSEKDYWSIREFFQKNTPDEVTASVLENITGLEKEAVTDYLVPALALLGLVKEGKPTNTLKSWINNAKYVKTCLSIAETVYPETLRKLGCKTDRKSTRLNSSHPTTSRMPSSA